MFGGVLDGHSNLQTNNLCIDKENNKKINVIEETPTRSRLEYSDQCVGYLVDDTVNHQRRMSVDDALFHKLWTRNNKSEKHAEKSEKREERKKNKEDTYYKVYHMDEDGHCGIEDFVASSSKTDYDQYEKLLGKEVHIRMWTEVYSTERAYLDKKELKEKRKENKIELTYESIKQFEREHDIPALPDNALKAIDMIMNK